MHGDKLTQRPTQPTYIQLCFPLFSYKYESHSFVQQRKLHLIIYLPTYCPTSKRRGIGHVTLTNGTISDIQHGGCVVDSLGKGKLFAKTNYIETVCVLDVFEA